MHLKKNFITQNIGSQQMMVAIGPEAENFHGMVKSNATAAFIVDLLKSETTEDEIVAAMLEEYDVEESVVAAGVKTVLDKLRSIGAIEDE